MSNQIAIETLQQKRQQLLLENETFLSRINAEINFPKGETHAKAKRVFETYLSKTKKQP